MSIEANRKTVEKLWNALTERANLNLGRLDEAEAALHAGLRLAPNQGRLLALARQLSDIRNQPTDDGG